MELLNRSEAGKEVIKAPSMFASHMRAVWEGLVKEHFGADVVDELFSQFEKKIAESSILSDPSYKHAGELLVLLKRISA